MVCPECGARAPEDANFCLSCGSSLDGAGSQGAAGQGHSEPGEGTGRTASDATAAALARSRTEAGAAGERDDGPELVDCANCAATNSARRVLCGRCGADLATGTVSARSRRPATAPKDHDTGELLAQRRRRGPRPWLVVVLSSVLVGAVVGGMAAGRVGPFAPEEPVEASFRFDPEVYPGESGDLEVAQVLASSTAQPNGDSRYDPAMVADGRLETAWNSDGELRPHGIGETLRLDLAQPSWIAGFVIGNGYQKDHQTFLDNARLERVRVSLADGAFLDVAVLDQSGRQVVQLDEPILTDRVTVTVLDSYPGRTYEDLGLSELELRGWAAVGTDLEAWEAYEQRRDQARVPVDRVAAGGAAAG